MDYDLKNVAGTIVDGSGSAGFRGDVGVVDGKVVTLGNAEGKATRFWLAHQAPTTHRRAIGRGAQRRAESCVPPRHV